MEYEKIVQDYARRTRRNLEMVDKLYREVPKAEVNQTSQLINSLFGMLMFIDERLIKKMENPTLEELERQGWQALKLRGEYSRPKRLHDLINHMREAIAHYSIEPMTEGTGITGIRVWNESYPYHQMAWEAELTNAELREMVEHLIDLILKIQ